MYSLLMLAIEDFAEILRAKRARGESRVNIGKHLGVSHESVRLWETGKRPAKSVLLSPSVFGYGLGIVPNTTKSFVNAPRTYSTILTH